MNSILLLFILGIMSSQQADGCNPYGDKTEVVQRANRTIVHVYNFITQLKMNLTMELTQMKMDQTTKIYLIMFDIAKDVMGKLLETERDRENIDNCYETWHWTLYRAAIATTMRLKECVRRTSDIFKPVRRRVEDFFNARTNCLLNLDDVRTNICEDNRTKNWEECVAAGALINPRTNIPSSCEYDRYIIKLGDLESNASSLFTTERDNASRCFQELERKYNYTMKPIIDVGMQCVSKILSAHN